jgi:Fe-S-cluster-containing dehydrogenase component
MRRRHFLKLLGIAPGVAALPWDAAGARAVLLSKLLPGDPNDLPDRAALCTECPAACGMRVAVRQDHPIKLEGDPDCPLGRGGLCIRGQAGLMRLYHPERLRGPLERAPGDGWRPIPWDAALARIESALTSGRGWYLSSLTTGAPADLQAEFAGARGLDLLPQYELFHYGALRSAYAALFGRAQVPTYRLGGAQPPDLLVTFGTDIFESFLHPVRQAREIAEAQRPGFRWFHCEPGLTLTGCNAMRRLAIAPGSEPAILLFLAHEAGRPLPAALPPMPLAEAARRSGLAPETLGEMAAALRAARRPCVLCGEPAGALLAGLLQHMTGQIGATVDFDRPENLDRVGTLSEVSDRARAVAADPSVGFLTRIHTLAGAPGVEELAARTGLVVGLTDFLHEPSRLCHIVLPLSHALESEGDAEPLRGWHVRSDPVFRPLYDTRSECEVLLALLRDPRSFREYRERWWTSRGLDPNGPRIAGREIASEPVVLRADALRAIDLGEPPAAPVLVLGPSVRMHDGRSSVIPLLHEIPDPVASVAYGSYAAIPEGLARERGWVDGTLIEVATASGSLRLPARVQPGQPDGCITVPIDQALAAGAGFTPWIDPATGEIVRAYAARVSGTGGRVKLALTSGSALADTRGILPGAAPRESLPAGVARSLYPPHAHKTYRWGMVIDLDKCTGCSACVAACYLENNVPIVGPDEIRRGREMAWLRIEPYLTTGGLFFLPLLCQHCDAAPCESVCPVYATMHDDEGLNVQVYNRCVGTRYCSNNCPYKVRRFNWFAHPRDAMLNPDVSVRPRGVMEKCTFCVQRIRAAKDLARDEARPVADGEVVPACAQSCPPQAIVFGNLLDPAARVSILARDPRGYRVLEDLGTEPAIRYLSGGAS